MSIKRVQDFCKGYARNFFDEINLLADIEEVDDFDRFQIPSAKEHYPDIIACQYAITFKEEAPEEVINEGSKFLERSYVSSKGYYEKERVSGIFDKLKIEKSMYAGVINARDKHTFRLSRSLLRNIKHTFKEEIKLPTKEEWLDYLSQELDIDDEIKREIIRRWENFPDEYVGKPPRKVALDAISKLGRGFGAYTPKVRDLTGLKPLKRSTDYYFQEREIGDKEASTTEERSQPSIPLVKFIKHTPVIKFKKPSSVEKNFRRKVWEATEFCVVPYEKRKKEEEMEIKKKAERIADLLAEKFKRKVSLYL